LKNQVEDFFLIVKILFYELYLERKERRDPPKFIDQLTDMTVFEGKSNQRILMFDFLKFSISGSAAKLRAEVKGKPTPTIEWLKNGEVIILSKFSLKYIHIFLQVLDN
jgi:hypothetical protein